ncbi:MAG: hypothetical protein M3295_09730 [Chloroflexota bacterium]|nr:hypothetical protein [Chloroflexota bacterium]
MRLRPIAWPLGLIAAYLVAYIAVTWPWAVQLWTQARSNGDTSMFAWTFWWMRHEVETLSWPFGTKHALAPLGGSLIFHGMQLTAFVSVPLQWLAGSIVAFNLMTVVLALLGGVATYALARDLGMPRLAAAVAGFLFLVSPHFAFRYHGGHTNLAHAFWIPLLLLLVRRYLREPTSRRAMLVGAGVAGSVYSDLTIAIYSVGLSLFYLIAVVASRRVSLHALPVRSLAAGTITFAILISGFVVELLRVAARHEIATIPGLARSWAASLDLGLVLVPHMAHEGPGGLGIAAPVLAGVATFVSRRRRLVVWLVALVIGCVVLGLGPQLVVFENRYVPVPVHLHGDTREASAVMPYTWVQAVMPHLRAPKRVLLVAALGMALLAGLAVASLLRHRRSVAVVVLVVAVPIALWEGRIPIRDIVDAHLPPLYDTVRADEDESAIVVNVPLGFRTGFGGYGAGMRPRGTAYIYAIQHEKPMSVGFFPRMDRLRIDQLARVSLYRDIIALQELPPGDPAPVTSPAQGRASALEYNLKYVVLARDVPGAEAVREYLERAGYELADRDETAFLYRLKR